MPKFRFKLESVLDIKKRREEMEKAELGRIQAELAQQMECLEKLRESLAFCQAKLRFQHNQVIDISEVSVCQLYASKLENDISQQEDKIKSIEKALERQREKLAEAVKEKKVLEKLKEKHFEEYQKEMLHIEQNLIDELGTGMFVRKER